MGITPSEDIRTTDSSQNVTNNPFPIINRRRVTTTVQVKDQQTVVIGGLMGKQTVDREIGVPGLCKVPRLGRLFTRIEQQEQEVEVAIFISPKIVIPTAYSAGAQSAPVAPFQPPPMPPVANPPAAMPIAPIPPAIAPEAAPSPDPVSVQLRVVPNS